MSTEQLERLTYSVRDLQVVLGMGKNTVYRLLKDGTIPNRQYGRKYVIGKTTIKKWLEGNGNG